MRHLLKGIAVLSAWLAVCLPNAQATSFDCAKAQSFAEKSICTSKPLQRLDEDLNSTYIRAIDRATEHEKAAVRLSQREWLKQRDACTTAACVSMSITAQQQRLAKWGSTPAAASSAKQAPAPQISIKNASPETPESFDVNSGKPNVLHQVDDLPSGSSATAATNQAIEQKHEFRPFKIALVAMFGLLLVCVWLHSRGSMVIYSDFTDALWTTMTPAVAVGTYLLGIWLEFSESASGWTALAVFGLMSLQVIIQTFRSNGVSPYFILALYAKIMLFTLFMLLIALFFFGGGSKSDRRRRRGLAVAAGAIFTFFTAWMCRNRYFSHIDDYLAGRT